MTERLTVHRLEKAPMFMEEVRARRTSRLNGILHAFESKVGVILDGSGEKRWVAVLFRAKPKMETFDRITDARAWIKDTCRHARKEKA